jgi:hypothetical protein
MQKLKLNKFCLNLDIDFDFFFYNCRVLHKTLRQTPATLIWVTIWGWEPLVYKNLQVGNDVSAN